MGDRGFNAGGYAYMTPVKCPRCGKAYLVGHLRLREGRVHCMNREKCAARKAKREGGMKR